jgi:carbamoyl-phosphate synthase large subunit
MPSIDRRSSADTFNLTAPPASATRSGAAVKVSEEILTNVPLVDVKKVVVVGSGGLSIGQAGEFDYSGKIF